MALGKMVVFVVDVGQGQCNYVEIYDSAGTVLEHTLLFDCGSTSKSGKTLLNIKQIAARVAAKADPAFDAVFFSHSDADHVNLMKRLLAEIAKTKKPLIGEVRFAGAHEDYTKKTKYSTFNILDDIVSKGYCASADIKGMLSNYSGYDPKSKAYSHYIWCDPTSSVYVYPLVGNVLSPNPNWKDNNASVAGTTPEALNRVSLISGLYYAGVSYIFCGDAINDTMAATTARFGSGVTVFNANVMTTLPHHGSRTTGLDVPSGVAASTTSVAVIKAFSALLKSQSITVSAFQQHFHPSLDLMIYFPGTLAKPVIADPRFTQPNAHSLVVWNDLELRNYKGKTINNPAYYTMDSVSNVFGTNYSNGAAEFSAKIKIGMDVSKVAAAQGVLATAGAIDPFACWVYTTLANGSVTLEGRKNLDSAAFTTAAVPAQALGVGASSLSLSGQGQATAIPLPVLHLAAIRPPAVVPSRFAGRLRPMR